MYQHLGKRLLDILVAGTAILLLAPVYLIIMLAIVLTTRNSPFFLQKRLGLNGQTFKIFKFQTMVPNAETIGNGLFVDEKNDTRITPIGQFLRRTSLDELPQLFNVLLGSMSLVGPRPPATYFPYDGYAAYPEWAKPRFAVRPGITGLAQVKGRNAITWESKFKIDLEYLQHLSLRQDWHILLLTVAQIFKQENIYHEAE